MDEECLKLTAYFAERDRSSGRFLGDALLEVCERHAMEASILLRGVEGFGLHQVLQTDRLLSLSEDLPAVLVAVDARARIEAALPELRRAAAHGLFTLERARMLSGSVAPPPATELSDVGKLTVYCGRHERVGRRPAFVAIVELLRRHGATAATVLLGVDGTAHGVRERARFFARNVEVPVMIIGVGGEVGGAAEMSGALPELAAMLARPLLTLERARICKRDGVRLADPHTVSGGDDAGLQTWVKLMVYADHGSRHAGRPLHVELVRRLRAAGAGGATVLQGIWGYHGSREPRGDVVLSLRRHVPTTTIVVDTPDRIGDCFDVIDELTDEAGVVTSELVPAFHARGGWGEAGGLRLAPRIKRV